MNPIALTIADGRAFFFGLTMVFVAEAMALWLDKGIWPTIVICAAPVGMGLVIASPTPLPFWAFGIWLLAAVAGLIAANRQRTRRRTQIAVGAGLLAATLLAAVVEAPYHFRPLVAVPPGKTVYVVGDSLSAGLRPQERCWPEALHDITGLPVVNLSGPGARVQDAMQQARRIQQPKSVVIVEIGGNDLLSGGDAGVFRQQLDALLAALRKDGREVLMFELPLYPFKTAFGRAQRELAAKYGATLFPSRCLTEVFSMTGGTIDGLHFTRAGHEALAHIVARMLRIKVHGFPPGGGEIGKLS